MTTRALTEMERRTVFDGHGRNLTLTCEGDVGLGLCAGKLVWRYDTIRCAKGHIIEVVESDDDEDLESSLGEGQ